MWYVYIIKSISKKWYYVGSTNSIERRLLEHNNRRVTSTKSHIPLNLVWKKEFFTEQEARLYERFLKDKRIEKERIIKSIS